MRSRSHRQSRQTFAVSTAVNLKNLLADATRQLEIATMTFYCIFGPVTSATMSLFMTFWCLLEMLIFFCSEVGDKFCY
jgi:hypothetical protein